MTIIFIFFPLAVDTTENNELSLVLSSILTFSLINWQFIVIFEWLLTTSQQKKTTKHETKIISTRIRKTYNISERDLTIVKCNIWVHYLMAIAIYMLP